MSILDNIKIDRAAACAPQAHNTLPLLHEIRHALQRLLTTGESTIIDLRAIPFGPGDEERLLAALGEGEVNATLDAIGRTTARETGYPGVWLVEHLNTDDERIAFQIEIIEMPLLLLAQSEDIADSLQRLAQTLEHRAQAGAPLSLN